jgi:hypothetical protein
MREAQPEEVIIGPATSLIDLPFIEACVKAGLFDYWSAVSVHPYRQEGPETVVDEYRKLRRLVAKYTASGQSLPILSGEWGYSSGWKNFDPGKQGKMLPREWLTNLANNIPLSIWYDWHDDGHVEIEHDRNARRAGFGLEEERQRNLHPLERRQGGRHHRR